MKKKTVTIDDIARYLNIATSTVSRALSDHHSISDQTKKLIKDTAKKLNYRPNSLAANFRKGKTKTIGLVVPRINRNFFSNVIHGVEYVANQFEYSLIICQSNETYKSELEAIETLMNNRVAGILISISRETRKPGHIKSVIEKGIPLVQFDRVFEEIKSNKVLNDNLNGAYSAVKGLIDQGYRRIVHFAGPYYINIYQDRYEGYKKALLDSGLTPDEKLVFENILTREEGYEKTMEIFGKANRPDAVFAASDFSALGAMIALKDMNIKIPGEVGVVGYANEPFTDYISPGLTSVDQHSVEMGQTAARLLFEEILNEDENYVPKTLTLKPDLVIRDSSSGG
ncbi:MAG: LacI family DNA-binding transcriptional regulator [Bacteroidales bacterium]|nr:LacI family DNA-binding transcriptional regulator [Bacteroidales bacterium]